MKRTMHLGGILAVALLLAGCKGFWNAPPSSGGSGGGAASGVFYVLNQKTNQLAAFAFASGSTSPAAITGSPYTVDATPLCLAISPNGSYLYVGTLQGIYLYTIGSGGALTIGNSGSPISQDPATAMQLDPTGSWLIEVVSGAAAVNAVPLTSAGVFNTQLQEQQAALPSTSVQQLAISGASTSTAPYVFVAMGSGGTAVVPFTAGNSKPFGNVATIKPRNTSGGDISVAVDVSNPLLYVGETAAVAGTQTGGMRVFEIGSGKISEITGSPFATGGTGPSAILSTSGFVYVANRAVSGSSAGNITGYSVTANTTGATTTYSLAKVSTINAGSTTVGLAEDSTSTYVLAVNAGGNPDLSTYTFDTTTTGKLDASATAATGTDPVQAIAIAAVP